MLRCLLAVILVATLTGYHALVSGAGDVCSAYMYPGVGDTDIKIVAVLGMHESDDDKCSATYNTGALQNAIALNWASSLLNGNNETASFIPGVRIGIEVYDDCNTVYLSARHAGAMASQHKGASGCSEDGNMSSLANPIGGVIGTSISHTTTVIASILGPSYIPVVGPSATVSELSNKSKYPHFVRVVPSDLKQTKVIITLAKHFSWSYIMGISTSDNYGTEGMAELKKLANEEMICMSLIEDFDLLSETQMEKFVRTTLVNKVLDMKENLGIVYFGLNRALIRFLKFIEQKRSSWGTTEVQALNKIYWVASDSVDASKELAKDISQYNTNILIVGPFLVNMNSFKEYFIDLLRNPPAWIRGQWKLAISRVVTNNLGCSNYNFTKESLAACKIEDNLVFDTYIPSILDAFYLLANTFKTVHLDACSGKSGPCDLFKSRLTNGLLKTTNSLLDLNYSAIQPVYLPTEFSKSSRQLQNVSGDFEVINQPLYSLQAIKKDNFVKAAEFEGDTVIFYSEFENIFGNSECKATCEECLSIEDMSYLFHPGDVIFLGIFSIQGPSRKDPYKCGLYREKSKSYVAMEAFINAIYQLNNSTGLKFGYLILDDCYNAVTLTRLLNGVMSGDIPIKNRNGTVTFNSSKVAVAIGAQSSPVTMAALPILTGLNIPMISYSSTNPHLDNRFMYPYFSRTVSSDTMQARAFVDILKEFEVTYIGAVVIQNSYGLELYELMKSFAESEKICVDDAVKVTEQTSIESFLDVLQSYRDKKIQVIVIIAMDKIVSTFFGAVKQEDTFIFIGSEAWGPNFNVIDMDNGKKARGSLVLAAASVEMNYGLKDHLQTLNPFANTSTAWLRDFWQDQFQCDMPGGFINTHGYSTCDSMTSINMVLDDLANSPLAAHATIATVSAGFTVRSFLNSKKQMPFNPKDFTDALNSIKLPSSAGEIRPFLDSGNGDFGFDIYNVQQPSSNSRDKFSYVNVGSYRSKTGLRLDKSQIKFYDATGRVTYTVNSSCLNHQECEMVCSGFKASTSPKSETVTPGAPDQKGEKSETSSCNTVVIILAVLLVLFVLIAITLIVLAVLVFIGKIQFKGRRPFIGTNKAVYDAMSSHVTLQKGQGNSYSDPNDSSCSDVCPKLPVRNNTDKKVAYTNKAFSDIVSPDHIVASESGVTRDRASSLPTLSLHRIDQKQELQPPYTLSIAEQHLPDGYIFPVHSGGSQTAGEAEQFRSMQKRLLTGNDAQHFGDQNTGDDNAYNGLYRNTPLHMNHSPQYSQEPIIFQNVPTDSALYTLPSSIPNNNHHVFSNRLNPQSVYNSVQTTEGIKYISSQDLQMWLNANGAFLKDQPNHALVVTNRPGQSVVDGVSASSLLPIIGGMPNSTPLKDYITPIDITYATTSALENPFCITSPENATQRHFDDNSMSVITSQTGRTPTISATTFHPASPVASTYPVDSSNYLLPRRYAQTTATQGTEVTFNAQDQNRKPLESDTLTLPISDKQLLISSMQHPGLEFKAPARPDSLAVYPVYLPNIQEAPHLFLQGQTNSSDELHTGHLPTDSTSPDNSRIAETHVEEKSTPEDLVRRQRGHHSPARKVLSLLQEEPEEMV